TSLCGNQLRCSHLDDPPYLYLICVTQPGPIRRYMGERSPYPGIMSNVLSPVFSHYLFSFSNGMPNFSSNSREYAGLPPLMLNTACRPCAVVVSSKVSSGNTVWSVKPIE